LGALAARINPDGASHRWVGRAACSGEGTEEVIGHGGAHLTDQADEGSPDLLRDAVLGIEREVDIVVEGEFDGDPTVTTALTRKTSPPSPSALLSRRSASTAATQIPAPST